MKFCNKLKRAVWLSVVVLLVLVKSILAVSTEADYYLPYPGILPDHPMYWVKMIRDRVTLWVEIKPLGRAEKLLIYADKRLGAGWALVEGNKDDLGVTTLTKAEKYLEKSIKITESLGETGEEVKFRERLVKAVKKHQEVLKRLLPLLENQEREVVEKMIR